MEGCFVQETWLQNNPSTWYPYTNQKKLNLFYYPGGTMPFIVSFVGYKKSGKTTLVERIIPILKSKGYKIGVLKYTGEGLPEETEGKDTAKFRAAGAETVGLCGDDHFTLFKAGGHPALPLDRLAAFFFPEADLVVTEGFKKQPFPKIALLSEGQEEKLLAEVKGVVLATVGPKPFREDLPHFQPEEAEGIVDLLEKRFLKERHEPRIRVWLDGKRIPMKDFVQDIIIQGIMGMLGTLRGFIPAGRVDITLSPQETSADGKPRKND
jgi:molybdopterin-guanine dinucleotide biosynthesis protein B